MGQRGSALALGLLAVAACRFDALAVGEDGGSTGSSGGTTGLVAGSSSSTGLPDVPVGTTDGSTTTGEGTSTDGGSSSGGESSSSGVPASSESSGGPSEIEYCTVAALPIPDANLDGVTSSIDVDLPGGGSVISLEVVIEASHPYVGDLRFDVRKDSAEVIVIDRPGGGSCSGNDIDVVLSDAAASGVTRSCLGDGAPGSPPALSGDVRPDVLLDPIFAGTQMLGTWRLRATDAAADDAGTLQSWCLRITYQ